MSLSTNDNYYQLLGVAENASFEDIRQAYHDVCRRFHPDKQAAGGKLTPDQLEFWSALQTAWRCLSVEVRRMIYDIRRQGKPLSLDDKLKIQRMQRDQAACDISNMQILYQQSVERERQKNGIIVMRALFGDLRAAAAEELINKENSTPSSSDQVEDDDRSPTAKQADSESAAIEKEFGLVGPVIDVTVAIQCSVDNHRVILASGVGKSDLPGFYNPTVFHHSSSSEIPASPSAMKGSVPCSLYVLYKFKGATHEVNVSETDALWLPLKAHAVTADKPVCGPTPPVPVELPAASANVPPTPMGMDSSRKQLKKKESNFFTLSKPMLLGISAIGLAGLVGLWLFRRTRK